MPVISRTARSSKRASMDMFSEIIDISPVADTVHPSGAGSRGGRPSFGTLDSGSLPWAVHRVPLSFPSAQPATALARGRKHIDSRPDLGGRAPVQMLMGSQVIVDVACVGQRPVERSGIVNRMWHQQPFQGSDQALDAAVLPGTAGFAVLQASAHTRQRQTKRPWR